MDPDGIEIEEIRPEVGVLFQDPGQGFQGPEVSPGPVSPVRRDFMKQPEPDTGKEQNCSGGKKEDPVAEARRPGYRRWR